MRFISHYLTSPLVEKAYIPPVRTHASLMRYEKHLRSLIAYKDLAYPDEEQKWSYYYSHGNWSVDFSTFYSTLTYVSFDAKTYLQPPKRGSYSLTLWTYAAVTVWCNGRKVCSIEEPVYKPIMKRAFTVELGEGRNELYIRLQTLGVRDTRMLFGIEIPAELSTVLTGEYDEHLAAASFLDNVRLEGETLFFPEDRGLIVLAHDEASPDFARVPTRYRRTTVSTDRPLKVAGPEAAFFLRVPVGGGELSRRFEIIERQKPEYTNVHDRKENYRRMLRVIADADGLSRGDKFGFYIQNILARKALGIEHPRDREYFFTTLQQIEDRYDCSDFLVSGVIRYMKSYPIDDELKARIDEVLINYRYWMSMDGSDGMCFWSENHSILFYSSALLAGEMYPMAVFPTARMTGSELADFGRVLTNEWFDDLEELGFEEFLSTVYMNVTFAALLNIYDYAEESISKRAQGVIDRLLHDLSLHTFDGSIIAPMGRVYRSVITPSKQGAQALMNLVNPKVPTTFGEGWLSYYATSSYPIPDGLIDVMQKPAEVKYSSGNALIMLKKERDYCLTSVQSPRTDGVERWKNITLGDTDYEGKPIHLYTKSFNERFHGTTFFEPGVYGYQQHMWSAALSNETIVFVNHPGGTHDSSSMRPGYWFGNGILPALRQEGAMLATIHRISDAHPIRFTHVFFPKAKFDSVEREGRWVFARKGQGLLALWCSRELVAHNDELADCELRAYSSDHAYVCVVGSIKEEGSFEAFQNRMKALEPHYAQSTLTLEGKPFLYYEHADDETQFV